MKNFSPVLLVMLLAAILAGGCPRQQNNEPVDTVTPVESTGSEVYETAAEPTMEQDTLADSADTGETGTDTVKQETLETQVTSTKTEVKTATKADPLKTLETQDFGEPENDGWKEEAGYLPTTGYMNLGDIYNDYRAFRIANGKIEIWNERRDVLSASMPDFGGDEDAFHKSMKRFGSATILSEESVENRHVEGQMDQILVFGLKNMEVQVYKTTLDSVKYITMFIEITGPIGIAEIDRVFTMSRQELFAYYGEMMPDEEGLYSFSNPVDFMESIDMEFSGKRVSRILFSGYVD
jgi:hypothetical protein